MMELREEVLDGPTARVGRHIRRYIKADGVNGPLMDTMISGLYTVALEALPQQTGTITAKLDA
jgi:hypothetical protein